MIDSTVTSEVRELRHEISMLRELLSTRTINSSTIDIRIFIERRLGERRPYSFVVRGIREKRLSLSTIRTAIAIALLLDLEGRANGLRATEDIRAMASQVFQLINPDPENIERLQEQIRVAFYRFEGFWKQELEQVIPAVFQPIEQRLFVDKSFESLKIEISSSDPLIEDALPKLSQTPVLERLRRDRFLFVPGGGRGAERFLEEIYSSSGNLEVMSTYARLQLITVPPSLLGKYNIIPEAAARHEVMHRRLLDRTLTFTEIIPEQGFEDLIANGPNSNFSYFQGMKVEEIIEHLRFVQSLLNSANGYRLILTRSDIPFYLGRYTNPSFSLSSFFKLPRSGPASAYSSFAVWGPDIGRMADASLFDWLIHHPSTTEDCTRITKYLDGVCDQLVNKSLSF